MTHADNIIRFDPGSGKAPETRPLCEQADDDLMLMARGGKREAFDVLVRRHQARVLGVAGKMLGHPQAARDAAQNAFLEVYRYLDRYRPRGKFKAFLHRVLINQCKMLLRSKRYEVSAREQLPVPVSRPDELPEEQLLARERRREVERALGDLSEKLRTVLVLRFAGGLSYEEIADSCSIPVGTVKSRIFSGLAKLRLNMEGAAR